MTTEENLDELREMIEAVDTGYQNLKAGTITRQQGATIITDAADAMDEYSEYFTSHSATMNDETRTLFRSLLSNLVASMRDLSRQIQQTAGRRRKTRKTRKGKAKKTRKNK